MSDDTNPRRAGLAGIMAQQLAQFGVSLLAIVAVFLLARKLRLGTARTIADVGEAADLAAETDATFHPKDIVLDAHGRAALLANENNEIMLLMPHGSHFVGRILTGTGRARIQDAALIVHTGERNHRDVALDLSAADAAIWMKRINGVRHTDA